MANNKNRLPNAVLEDVNLIWLNFAGKTDQYNTNGDREFTIRFGADQLDVAEALAADGYNVRDMKRRDDDDPNEPLAQQLKVKVSYKIRAPKIFLVTSRGKTPIGEAEVSMLDWQDIAKVDLILNPSYWEVNGKTGIKAYLQSMYMTINEDELDLKYGDVQSVGPGAMQEFDESEFDREAGGVRFR